MTITLELKPDIEAKAIQQASAKGIAVEDFLVKVIETNLTVEDEKPIYESATFEEWKREFTAWVEGHSHLSNVPPVDDSRDSIYREREDSQL